MKHIRWFILVPYFLLATTPLIWLGVTSLKTQTAAINSTATIIPSTKEYVPVGNLHFSASLNAYQKLAIPSSGSAYSFLHYLNNSLIIGLLSTLASVALGTGCAYGFSRFQIRGAQDWLFFILSTRFLPPLAVVVPVLMMYRQFDLPNTHLGLILLYTAFNLSLAVWLMKGFIDDMPRAYEEAALVDGYTRFQAFYKIILPQSATGMAVTAVFCMISAWNEYGFALALNNAHAVTVPVYFAGLQGNIQGIPWPQIAAGVLIFALPIVIFTVLVRNHLLRGVTFGTIKQ
ncbi:MAG: carbohydrate ABC transporter permease [Candidatus Latescibacteria bacterium]|jgi:multiple sugar transport system permease protein|nr:carbohydrate ABC transporter permease [Candidatus Latescibacterota bacterium]MBT4137922.1 carbohydrate ABC transporter permease [Candidatus Latescibacterota bacterium]MBT5832718.1 carbohydrate ABC transporter permease [Candidatus Latescibacterota bacterium]